MSWRMQLAGEGDAVRVAVIPPLPKFDPAMALERDLLDAMLSWSSGTLPISRRRWSRRGRVTLAWPREAFNGGDLIIGAFLVLSGVDLFSKGELDEAAATEAAGGPRT